MSAAFEPAIRHWGFVATALWVACAMSCSSQHNDVTGSVDDNDSLDVTPPLAVTDLHVSRIGPTEVELCWTAPGDDGVAGRAMQYMMRGSTDSITAINFDSLFSVPDVPFPDSAGSEQCVVAGGLAGDHTYWAAMKTMDESGNWSDLSNCVRFTCLTDSMVLFPDTALEQAVRAELNHPTEPLRRSHVLALHHLLADDKGISDLTGLEYCAALQTLTVPNNRIRDLQPLANLGSLRILSLVNNQISDLSHLAALDSLATLFASRNPVSDLSPLSGLTALTDLSLATVSTSDFTAISGLFSLRSLDLSGNAVATPGALSALVDLRQLYLVNCHLGDLAALQTMVGLEELGLAINHVADLGPLVPLVNLRNLDLYHNSVADIAPLLSNVGLGSGDTVRLTENPLSTESVSVHIPVLQARGVNVIW